MIFSHSLASAMYHLLLGVIGGTVIGGLVTHDIMESENGLSENVADSTRNLAILGVSAGAIYYLYKK